MRDIMYNSVEKIIAEENQNGTFNLAIKNFQHIPSSFLEENRELRDLQGKRFRKGRDAVMAARIPEHLANKWFREGFNVFGSPKVTGISANMIIAKLKAEGYDDFVTTTMTF